MKRLGLGLLVLMMASGAAATDVQQPEASTKFWIDGSIGQIGFDATDTMIVVEPTFHRGGHSLEVLIFIGNETDALPHEWYLFHFGNATLATDMDGRTLRPEQNGTLWRVERGAGAAGDCLKVVAQEWHRVDGEKQITWSNPSDVDPAKAWQDLPCHEQGGRQAAAPEPKGDKDSPGPAMLAVLATVAALAVVVRKRT